MSLYELLLSKLNNEHAATFCVDIYHISQFWDDLIDRDKEYSDTEIHSYMYKILFDLYDNPFFRKYEFELKPIMKSAIIKWMAANSLESRKEQLDKAYMLRASIYDIFAYCYFLLHGLHIDTSEIYSLYGEHLNTYKKEIENA